MQISKKIIGFKFKIIIYMKHELNVYIKMLN